MSFYRLTFPHLPQSVAAGVVEQAERLGAGGPGGAGVWPHMPPVVLVNTGVEVSQVNHLR